MFPCEGKKWLIHLTARDQTLKDAMEFIHRNESTSGKQPGLIQTFCAISIRPHPPSVSQLFLSKISLAIYWLDGTDGIIWFHFSFAKNQASLKLKYLSGAKEEQQMLQECLFICNAIRAGCTGSFYSVTTGGLQAAFTDRAAVLGMSGASCTLRRALHSACCS